MPRLTPAGRLFVCISLILYVPVLGFGQATEPIPPLQENACRVVSAPLDAWINYETGTILSGDAAAKLIGALLTDNTSPASCSPTPSAYKIRNFPDVDAVLTKNVANKGDFIIHTVVLGAATTPSAGNTQQAITAQTWYLLHDGKLLRPGRLLGTKRLWFVYLHINKSSNYVYTSRYEFTVADKIPANQQNLLGLFATLTGASGLKLQENISPTSENVWGGMQIDMTSGTSDIQIQAKVVVGTNAQPLDNPLVLHNEAPPWWDVSVGIPIAKMSQLTFPPAGSNSAVTPTNVDKKSIYGLFDYYYCPAQKKQMMYDGYSLIPSLIAGLPVAQHPLQKPLIAAGIGLRSIQVYVGAVIAKQPTVPVGATTTSRPCTGWCPQFAFGINLTVKGLQSQLAAQTANAGNNGNSKPGVTAPALQTITVTPANPQIAAKGTQPFAATGTYSDGSSKDLTGSVNWTSLNLATATISPAGLATGVAAGSTTIKATQGSASGTATLTVTPAGP